MSGPIVLPPPTPSAITWGAIRDAMATRVSAVGLLVSKARTPIALADDDVAIVEPMAPGIEPNGFGLMLAVYLRVVLIVNRATVEDSERALDEYLWPKGTNSVIAAVRADPTLGGVVQDTLWTGVGWPYGTPEGSATGRQSEAQFKCAVDVT